MWVMSSIDLMTQAGEVILESCHKHIQTALYYDISSLVHFWVLHFGQRETLTAVRLTRLNFRVGSIFC